MEQIKLILTGLRGDKEMQNLCIIMIEENTVENPEEFIKAYDKENKKKKFSRTINNIISIYKGTKNL